MNVAYLVNRYPAPSHSFIRREIQALERLGARVYRFSIRDTTSGFLDALDRAEAEKTRVVLDSPLALLRELPRVSLSRVLACTPEALKLGFRSDRGPLIHLAYLAEAARLASWCRELGVNHLHAHFATNPAAVALYTNRLTGLPFSFTVHGPEVFDRPTLLSLQEKVSAAKFVACISHFTRGQLCRWCDSTDWGKLQIVRCGLDFEETRNLEDDYAGPLVCVGRLCEQKGYWHLLEALEILFSRGFRPQVVLVGDGPLRDRLEARVHELGLQETVFFRGWASQSQVFAELARARALLLPSLAEGLPVVLMEAFALKRPVVASWVSGVPELVEAERNGWLVPPGDSGALADAVEKVLNTGNTRLRELGRHGYEKVRRLHDINREAEKLLTLLMP